MGCHWGRFTWRIGRGLLALVAALATGCKDGGQKELDSASQSKAISVDLGGGVKMDLAGPLRLRVDYRVFKQGGGALYSPAHRIYAGLNVKF